MANNRTEFSEGSTTKTIVYPGREDNYRDGTYYLYYSGDNWCGENASYAVMIMDKTPGKRIQYKNGSPYIKDGKLSDKF